MSLGRASRTLMGICLPPPVNTRRLCSLSLALPPLCHCPSLPKPVENSVRIISGGSRANNPKSQHSLQLETYTWDVSDWAGLRGSSPLSGGLDLHCHHPVASKVTPAPSRQQRKESTVIELHQKEVSTRSGAQHFRPHSSGCNLEIWCHLLGSLETQSCCVLLCHHFCREAAS